MDSIQTNVLALHATSTYIMNHIAGIMEIVQDQYKDKEDGELGENEQIAIETQVKAIAEKLTRQSMETPS